MQTLKLVALVTGFQLAIAHASTCADLEHGRKIFESCASCHIISEERNAFGPYLKGIVGRNVAVIPDYEYSQAMKALGASGGVWDEKLLAAFLAKPSRAIPGTKMRFWGLWGFEVNDLIAYLKANP